MPNEEEEEPTEDESSSEEEEEMEEEEREEEAEWDDAEADAKQQDVLQKAAAAASMSALTAAANARTAAATKTSAAVRGQPITLRLGLEADRRLKNAEKLLEQTSLTPADRAALIKMFGEDAGDKKELEARRKAVAELKIAQDRQFDEAEREDKAQEQKDRAADEAEVNEMMKKEAGEQRAQQEFAEAMKRGREQFEAGGGAQETPEERKKRRKDALKKMSGQGDIRAYLIKLFNEKKDDDDDIAVLADILSAALEESGDEEVEPEPGPEPNITPRSLRPRGQNVAEQEADQLRQRVAELERELRQEKMMKPAGVYVKTQAEEPEPEPVRPLRNLESSDDDRPEPQPEPDPEFNITALQQKVAELERQLRASKMMKPVATIAELAMAATEELLADNAAV